MYIINSVVGRDVFSPRLRKNQRDRTHRAALCVFTPRRLQKWNWVSRSSANLLYNVNIISTSRGIIFRDSFFCSKGKRPRKGRVYNSCMCIDNNKTIYGRSGVWCLRRTRWPVAAQTPATQINSFPLMGKNAAKRCSNYYSNYMGSNNIPTLPYISFLVPPLPSKSLVDIQPSLNIHYIPCHIIVSRIHKLYIFKHFFLKIIVLISNFCLVYMICLIYYIHIFAFLKLFSRDWMIPKLARLGYKSSINIQYFVITIINIT